MKTHIIKTIKQFRDDVSGAIAVETSLIALTVFLTIPMMMDVATTIKSGLTLSSSLRSGTHIALIQPTNTSAISEAVQVSSGFDVDRITVTTSMFCECDGIEESCSTATCPGGETPSTYMTLTAIYDTPTFYSYPEPNPFGITRSTSIRVR